MMDDIAALRQVPLFKFMDDQEIGAIRAIMDSKTYPAGTVISQQGQPDHYFNVLLQGHVQFMVKDASNHELVVDEVGPGGFFGEMSMLTGEPRFARVQAVDGVAVLALDRREFFSFLEAHPPAALDVLQTLGQRLHRTDSLLRQSVSRNVNDVEDGQLSFGQRIADKVAATMGSWRFIIIQSCILSIWITLNVVAIHFRWDPYPFILLNLVLSFQAAYAAPIIMMSQNRQSDKDRLAADIDHEVNTKAELEVGIVIQRLDDLTRLVQQQRLAGPIDAGNGHHLGS